LESGGNSPAQNKEGNAVLDEAEEAATHTDFGDYLSDECDAPPGDGEGDGYYDH